MKCMTGWKYSSSPGISCRRSSDCRNLPEKRGPSPHVKQGLLYGVTNDNDNHSSPHGMRQKGAKAIHLAAMTGNLEVIKNVLEKGENVDVKTADGFTPLHLAVQCIKPEAVEILLGYGAKVFVTAGKGETPLHTCARHEQGHKCADLLIKCGAPVNAPDDDGDTPFHVACRSGHLSTLKLLLADQADFTILNKNGENVLHVVAKECHFGIAQRLLKHMLDLSGKDMVIKMINQKNKV